MVLRHASKRIRLNALLDDCSSSSYLNEAVAKELGLSGELCHLTVNVLNANTAELDTELVSCTLESVDGTTTRILHAFTLDKVTGEMPASSWEQVKRRWPHLAAIQFPPPEEGKVIDLLIGMDCLELHCSLQEVEGKLGEPMARLTRLGWTCVGHLEGGETGSRAQVAFCQTHVDGRLEELVRDYWAVHEPTPSEPMSPDDRQAMDYVDSTMSREGTRYQVVVPWRPAHAQLPCNLTGAIKRLEGIGRRLKRQPALWDAYDAIRHRYLEQGYIVRLPDTSAKEQGWWLVHFPMLRPDKATTKVRVVFDGAARHQGTSLNAVMYKGPKLQQDLIHVLLRFRRYRVAIVCDIREMYLQVQLHPDDRKYHRFVWQDPIAGSPLEYYEFQRVVFGSSCSPFLAQLVARRNAERHQARWPRAAEAALCSTYMDDTMDSVPDEKAGVQLHLDLVALWGECGMAARKWLSNSPEVLSHIPASERAEAVDLDMSELPCTKTLGIMWLAGEDCFTFRCDVPTDGEVSTKRRFLSRLATLFDPLGFLAPYTITGRILMQDIWRVGIGWDQAIPGELQERVTAWFGELGALAALRMLRALQLVDGTAPALHVFSDASNDAYGAVCYTREMLAYGDTRVTIVMARSRVAP